MIISEESRRFLLCSTHFASNCLWSFEFCRYSFSVFSQITFFNKWHVQRASWVVTSYCFHYSHWTTQGVISCSFKKFVSKDSFCWDLSFSMLFLPLFSVVSAKRSQILYESKFSFGFSIVLIFKTPFLALILWVFITLSINVVFFVVVRHSGSWQVSLFLVRRLCSHWMISVDNWWLSLLRVQLFAKCINAFSNLPLSVFCLFVVYYQIRSNFSTG